MAVSVDMWGSRFHMRIVSSLEHVMKEPEGKAAGKLSSIIGYN